MALVMTFAKVNTIPIATRSIIAITMPPLATTRTMRKAMSKKNENAEVRPRRPPSADYCSTAMQPGVPLVQLSSRLSTHPGAGAGGGEHNHPHVSMFSLSVQAVFAYDMTSRAELFLT